MSGLSFNYHQGNGDGRSPVLVFLHGLLGSAEDWRATQCSLKEYPTLTIDLAGHGQSVGIATSSAAESAQQVATVTEQQLAQRPCILIGYSMGGRIAMQGLVEHAFAALNLRGALIEGGNFGLVSEHEKQQRWISDSHWAKRFREEPIEQVLADWYQQGVFSSLNHAQKQTLIAKRSANLGASVAEMLLATSLAKQPNLLPQLQRSSVPLHYVCGEKDTKFQELARQSGLSCSIVDNAGHNVHQEQPSAFADIVRAFIHSVYQR
ncbi:2-succinyl-6-hydroxy-2,4-cyclohexadiene-1-carboxylate synthase [Vibrio vulnificus]|uniref:Putative 2-succinyl-6-hydroxy-2,4-cyclohexadiene-1-carboxylate synthase n=1 Tax=Vibrio vulnificus TaxID=672 RepID=A0ABX4WXT5_VIBVL|nr:2-succinyl-6-hydroxy-2,4-cyclohexadiene-1-carboxylate synthase [Vibrio vulnificus]EGQ7981286.1 2-succinyl-6-hydroxy-2,4-cyclohexadiene-1-carboxylate synthase [Vibrio vulnificus]EGQ8091215.1 2-succinyl-6-hydroxy-2,4-cyclohexadiene-1-carboxylate synthase [Vibrio vulnificus]EGQ9292911.1 2-succinyl-6-hydroxy-2,4-cyclohexadiene-1-carboxylate synthase [Vibrio vulnificus]EGQ9936693.1 2-succinyl-6-hydroxy-2,4-cyclohexadiene-1-carboxylate synthase [Vibrio vulnificus]EGQ9990507.1 2-succinyl-6-hydroxy